MAGPNVNPNRAFSGHLPHIGQVRDKNRENNPMQSRKGPQPDLIPALTMRELDHGLAGGDLLVALVAHHDIDQNPA